MQTERTYIGVAWPYANGGLHLGHVAGSLLPPDIFKRYSKLVGREVLMVSGSDCHGTPILLKAEKDGVSPQELVEKYNADHKLALERLGIDFDLFTSTRTENHTQTVHEIFLALLEEGLLSIETQDAPFDAATSRFLPDRYVEGTCPHCSFAEARGDQCDNCGKTLEPQELLSPRSKLHPEHPISFKATSHYFLRLDLLQEELAAWIDSAKANWRPNVVNFTLNWLKEGLRPRPITRDLDWGVSIPVEGSESKCIYVWFEAVCGYLSAAKEWGASTGKNFADFWQNPATKGYYFLGKDNIPFHTIIWPAIIMGYNRNLRKQGKPTYNLPYDVPANEFLNLDGKQFSKSRGVSIAVHDVLDFYQADAIRYYLGINMPEGKDTDWTWDDFLAKVNTELVGTMGNLAHRIQSFVGKNLGVIPARRESPITVRVDQLISSCQSEAGAMLEKVELKKGLRRILDFSNAGNQLMQEIAPWKLWKEDQDVAEAVLFDLLRLTDALGTFLLPYLPQGANQILENLGITAAPKWSAAGNQLIPGTKLVDPKLAFVKLEAENVPPRREVSQKIEEAEPAPPAMDLITIDDFTKVKLRIGKIVSVEAHPKADKLLVMQIDAGELGMRQIVAGLKAHYEPAELLGTTVAFVANLQPVMLRGVESQGMILAADQGDIVSVLQPQRAIGPGATIR